MTLLHS